MVRIIIKGGIFGGHKSVFSTKRFQERNAGETYALFTGKRMILLEDDAPSTLVLGDADLFNGVGGERVSRGEQRRLGLETVLVSNVGDLSEGAVREGEPVEGNKRSGWRVSCCCCCTSAWRPLVIPNTAEYSVETS